jgi:hypothetical protein
MQNESVAIVTGASQGIGRATAIRLARDFESVVLTARQSDELEKTAEAVKSTGGSDGSRLPSDKSIGLGFCCRRKSPYRKITCSALRRPSFITPSDKGLLVPTFSNNTSQPFANRLAFTESVKSIEPRPRSMSNMIARTRRASRRIECPMLHFVGRGRAARHVLHKRWRLARHLASMGSSRAGTGDERWPLLSGREPSGHGGSHPTVPREMIK